MTARRAAWTLVIVLAAGAARAHDDAEAIRERVRSALPKFTEWAAKNAERDEPEAAWLSLGPQMLPLFVRQVPRDPRSQLALGIALLQDGHAAEAVRPLILATGDRDRPLARRGEALLGCALVTLGRYREAIPHLDAAPDDASCRWGPQTSFRPSWRAPVAAWRAAARLGAGDARGTLHVVESALAARSRWFELAPGQPDVLECLAGDAEEQLGDIAAARARWTRGRCRERLDELDAVAHPFDVVAARWPHFRSQGADPALLLGLTSLGALADAEAQLDAAAAQCSRAGTWTPLCLRSRRMSERVAPALADLRAQRASLRVAVPRRSFRETRVPPGSRLPFVDDDTDLALDPSTVPAGLAGWEIERVDRDGASVAALTMGHGPSAPRDPLDTRRLRLSSDGGATFGAPLWLGFSDDEPWVVRSRSRVPLVDGGVVRVEILRCLPGPDDDVLWPCSGPPVASLLTWPVPDLARDTDGDGLTDAQEDWWLTNPRDRDTDHDGVADAIDFVPRMPDGDVAGLASLIDALAAGTYTVATEPVSAEASDEHPAPRSRPSLQQPLVLAQVQPIPFLDQRRMSGHRPASPPPTGPRLIVMTEAEADRRFACSDDMPWRCWRAGGGLAWLMVVMDADGSRAILDVVRGEEGGTYLAERGPEGWILHGGIGWVS